MARIRSLKPEYFDDEELGTQTSRDARLMYPGLWCYADEHSRVRGNPAWIKGKIFPFDEDVTPADVDRWISELEAVGSVVRYEVKGASYLFLPNLSAHQRLDTDKVPSRLPAPPCADGSGKFSDDSENVQTRVHASLKHVASSREQVAGGKNPASRAPAAAIAEVRKATDASDVEAEAVVLIVEATRKPKNLIGLVRTMALAGDLLPILVDARSVAAKAERDRVLAAARDGPECEHGMPGGEVIHPDSGKPRCLSCRNALERAEVVMSQ